MTNPQAADSQIARALRRFASGQAWNPLEEPNWMNLYTLITQNIINDLNNAYAQIIAHQHRDMAYVQDLRAYNQIMTNIIPAGLVASDGPINITINSGGAITAADIGTLNDAFQLMLAKSKAANVGGGQPRNPAQSFQDVMANLNAYIQTQAILPNLITPRPGNIPPLQAMYASCSMADRMTIDALGATIPAGHYSRADVIACLQMPAPGPGMIRTANLTQMCYQFNCMRICVEANLTQAQERAVMFLIATSSCHFAVTDIYFRLIAARNPNVAAILGQLNQGNLTLYDHPHLVSIQRFVRGCTLMYEGLSHLSVLRVNRPNDEKLHLMSEILRLSPPTPNLGTTSQGEHMFHMFLVATDHFSCTEQILITLFTI